jgi:CRP-like cAMP-binding protein
MANRGSDVFRPTTPADCAGCPANHRDLFASLDESERSRLIESFRIASMQAHEVIYHAGDPGEYVYMLHFGLVKLLRYSSSGSERIVGLARSGDTIGMAALSQIPYRRTAVAMSACRVCRVPAAVVRDYNRHHPEFLASVLELYQASIEMADTFLTELSTGSAHQRLARLLLFLTEKDDHGEAPLLSREDMGALLGITTETASRLTAEFRRAALIEVVAADRCRCRTEALQQIALAG